MAKHALTMALAACLAGPAAAQTRVTIGVLSDFTGVFSEIGGAGAVDAVRMAVEDFAPAQKGLAVDIVSADPQLKPDLGVAIARRWFDTEAVDVIVDVPTSGVALALQTIVRDANKVMLATAPGSAELTGAACTPNTVHWVWDTWSNSHGTTEAIVKAGGKTWFFLTTDYAFGHAMEADSRAVVVANGGAVLGAARHPLNTKDFSSFVLQAQASGAQIVGLANGGPDTVNAIKTAAEFGLTAQGQTLAGLILYLSDVHALGLKLAQGLLLTTAFYWDRDPASRAFGERFAARNGGRMPTMSQAGAYSATRAYLTAVVRAGGAKDGAAVVAAMRAAGPFDDPLFGRTEVRVDGRAVHDMYLVAVKTPEESKRPYDYYSIVSVIPAARAFRPLAESPCPLARDAR